LLDVKNAHKTSTKNMNHSTILAIIIIILSFDFILERVLDYLNYTRTSSALPQELQGIYDDEKYLKQQRYEKENSRFSLITSTFSFLLLMGMLLLGGFSYVDNLVQGLTANPIAQALLFFGILMFAMDLLNTPFDIYDTFGIEAKYGFNTMTVKTYILDKLKGWMLALLIGGLLLGLIVWFITTFPSTFWIMAWAVLGIFTIFMAMFYSSLIVPLFNKQTPLEDGELKQSINDFSNKAGFKLDNIFVIDGSKRSTKANAYFSGLGAKKRIVLFDTLIKDLSTREIVAVLAHEIGHYKKKHVISMIFISLVQTALMLFILGYFINQPALSQALGASTPSIHVSLITFGILYSPLSMIIGMFVNILSRKNEYEADGFASQHGESEGLQSALKKLSEKNLSNLTPHPAYVFFHYSHPTLLQRLRNLAARE